MKIVEANEGQKIEYDINKTWLNFDDQIMLNLKKMEADNPVHVDITADAFGMLHTGEGLYYVAQIDIPARGYTEKEIDNPDYDGENEDCEEGFSMSGKSRTIIQKNPIPFSMDNVTLTLYALKEGVF